MLRAGLVRDPSEIVGAAEHGSAAERHVLRRRRIGIDEADRQQPQLRLVREPPLDERTDLAGADDQSGRRDLS